jgi:heptosyltransferase-1
MTSRADKLWPEARWIELGRALGRPVVLPWGNAEERGRAERIARGVGEALVPDRMTLEALARMLAGAKSVVGLDSGLSHLAAAFGAPSVAIFCASDPALTGLYGAPRARNIGAPGRPPQVVEVLQALLQALQ